MEELSINEKSLLETMKNGTEVIYRATVGIARYSIPGHGEHDCTRALEGLLKKKLVEVEKIDNNTGWVWYKAK